MPRRALPTAILVCVLTACSGTAEPSEAPERAAVASAEDPSGDVELTIDLSTAPDEPRYAQVDLTGVEVQRRSSGLTLVWSVAGDVGVEDYRAELTFSTSTRPRAQAHRSVLVIAHVGPGAPFAGVQTSGGGSAEGGSGECEAEVTVTGDRVRVEVPETCLPPPFPGRAGAGSSLYTDSEDSELALAHDGVVLAGRPGLPAAP